MSNWMNRISGSLEWPSSCKQDVGGHGQHFHSCRLGGDSRGQCGWPQTRHWCPGQCLRGHGQRLSGCEQDLGVHVQCLGGCGQVAASCGQHFGSCGQGVGVRGRCLPGHGQEVNGHRQRLGSMGRLQQCLDCREQHLRIREHGVGHSDQGVGGCHNGRTTPILRKTQLDHDINLPPKFYQDRIKTHGAMLGTDRQTDTHT